MKLILSCGGTGGHITPALAIADIVRMNDPCAEIWFVGSEKGMEREMVTRAGYPIRVLRVEGLTRRLTPDNIKVLWHAATAVRTATQLLRDLVPDAVVGTGGYACYPTLSAAARMGIPTAVHESNAVPGLAVRRLAHRVDRVWLGFENARLSLHGSARILVTGNPLPVGFRRPQSKAPLPYGCSRMILSFGGSLGARELNRAVISLMEAQRGRNDVYHLHATGRGGYEDFMKELQARGLNGERRIKVVPFIENMPQHMAAADLVICRAGAMSISELAAAGKAAILIPSPNVVGNHQYRNAAALKAAGAAVLLEEARAAELPSLACELMANDGARRELSRRIAAFAERDAGRMIYEDLRRLILEKRDGKR